MAIFLAVNLSLCPMDPHTQISDKTEWKIIINCANGSTRTKTLEYDPYIQVS